ncbi:BTAD domain-containing putative transcriptional regulator [Luedemannella flava]|uniref:BTAD domain-containing putative transcriptional regulator n=1 Tax=Luedemannella flava TaxID=349316 RepID=A0ABP4Y3F6_9ACTN
MSGEAVAQVLGGFRLTVAGQPVTAWGAGRARALFQYLLLHRDRVVSREELGDALWPRVGATSVKVAVHAVRRVLGDASIVTTERGYQLNGERVTTDLARFESSMRAGTEAARVGDRDAVVAHLTTAMAHYAGPLLPDEDSLWLLDQREWLHTQALRGAHELCRAALDAGDDWTVIQWARRASLIDPYDFDAYELIVAAHHRLGLRGQARRWTDVAARANAELIQA